MNKLVFAVLLAFSTSAFATSYAVSTPKYTIRFFPDQPCEVEAVVNELAAAGFSDAIKAEVVLPTETRKACAVVLDESNVGVMDEKGAAGVIPASAIKEETEI